MLLGKKVTRCEPPNTPARRITTACEREDYETQRSTQGATNLGGTLRGAFRSTTEIPRDGVMPAHIGLAIAPLPSPLSSVFAGLADERVSRSVSRFAGGLDTLQPYGGIVRGQYRAKREPIRRPQVGLLRVLCCWEHA